MKLAEPRRVASMPGAYSMPVELIEEAEKRRQLNIIENYLTRRHASPIHPGTGTDQTVHGGEGSVSFDKPITYPSFANWQERLHVPKTERWDTIREAMDIIADVHRVPAWISAIPLKASKGRSRVGAYRYTQLYSGEIRPKDILVQLQDSWSSSAVGTMIHELAHYLDQQGFLEGQFASMTTARTAINMPTEDFSPEYLADELAINNRDKALAFDEPTTLAWGNWWKAVQESEGFQKIGDYDTGILRAVMPEDYYSGFEGKDDYYKPEMGEEVSIMQGWKTQQYRMAPEETFARAYQQYMMTKSDNPTLVADYERAIAFEETGGMPRYWGKEDFEPVRVAMDGIFRSSGWLLE